MKELSFVISLLALLAGCAPRVTVDTAQNIDFSQYHTYTWMDPSVKAGQNPLYYNQIATQNVEQTVDQVLSGRGLQKNDRRPDLLIGYNFFVQEKTRNVSSYNGPVGMYGPYYGWGRWGYGGWGPSWWGWNSYGPMYNQQQYEAGTLVVDMVDAKTKQLIWRGSVQNAVGDPARINQQLTREVAQIVERFPQGRSS